jgi:hypothetical protein
VARPYAYESQNQRRLAVAIAAIVVVIVVGTAGYVALGISPLDALYQTVTTVTTIGLIVTTRLALKERSYSAVMAATGLLYLAILTAFGIDLVARALLSSAR